MTASRGPARTGAAVLTAVLLAACGPDSDPLRSVSVDIEPQVLNANAA